MLDTLHAGVQYTAINTGGAMLQDPFADKHDDDLAAAKGIGIALCMSAVLIFGLMLLAWVVL